MKKYSIFAAVLVLTLSVFTGCGCRGRVPETTPSTEMTLLPTDAMTEAATNATTEATTEHTTIPTGDQNNTTAGIDDDMGAENNNTAASENRARGRSSRIN